MKRTLVWLTILILLAACIPTSDGGPADATSANDSALPEPMPLDPDDPLVLDAASLAEDLGISLEEAVQRLTFQQTIGEIQPALESELPAAYGGLWIEHEPAYRIVIALTEGDEETIREYVTGKPWAEFVEVRRVAYTLRQLHDAQRNASEAADSVGAAVSSGVNVMQNRVELYVGNPQILQDNLEAAGIILPSSVAILPANPDRPLPPTNEGGITLATTEDGRVIYLPTLPPSGDSMAALIEGTLIEDHGCLRVTDEAYPNGFLILWPYGSELLTAGDAIEVRNGAGQVVGRVGEPLRIGGGAIESSTAITRLNDTMPGMPIDGCSGPYWVAGELETLAEQSVADVYVTPFTSDGGLLATFISQSRPAEAEGTLTGELVVNEDGCMQVNGHTILWPPDVYLREDPLHLVVPGEVPLADVGYPVTIPGALKEPGDYRYFENKVPCPGPYWGAAEMTVVE